MTNAKVIEAVVQTVDDALYAWNLDISQHEYDELLKDVEFRVRRSLAALNEI
jgi:hypothetical protein